MNMRTRPCPCCGAPYAEPTSLDTAIRAMPATFAAVVRVVARRPGIRLTELAEEVYRNAPNGGPVTAYNCISTAISRHRARLELFGIRLAYVGGNQQGGFKLVFDKVGA